MATVAETIAQSLHDAGVRLAFGMPGGEVVSVLEALQRVGIGFELMHHEQSAVFAADAYARATGKPGCALTTLGPGALNAVPGIGHAWLDRAPVVLITAQKPDSLLPDYTHQVVDLQTVFSPITKRTLKVTPENAAAEVPAAVALTMQGRPGPVHLQISNEEAELPVARLRGQQVARNSTGQCKVGGNGDLPDGERLSRARDIVAKASRPVILAGLGLEPEAPYDALRALAEAANAPVILSPKGKGALPDGHPLSAGVIGLTRTDPVYEILEESDCVVAVGFDVVELVKEFSLPQSGEGKSSGGADDVPLIWIANWPNYDPVLPADVELVGSMTAALMQLAGSAFCTDGQWGETRVRAFHEQLAALPLPTPRHGHLLPQQLLEGMRRHMSEETLLAVDVGSHKIFGSLEWPTLTPNSFALSNGLSCMGFGLPAAIGTALARPDESAACLIGDGGLLMCLGELAVLARLDLPVIVVVAVDNAIDLIRSHQIRQGKKPFGTEFPAPDFCKIAAGYGIAAARVSTQEECDEALACAAAARAPYLIEAIIDPVGYPTTPR
ncbi:MAG: thiamine pyrophosphate-binding protein [Caldilineaceae bacterium SB0664_bin_27]|uniref:Thiamine pyrophosphate-binding protein n=1 Tax=Caldilineaceae bacterium SB0664_bin_27 TaxID=2605260 RepID=A0A6B0YSV0_9CHLR|nr:thiamine pyrophosphate-binding protein [Caldilineaceae bacterium SB0664_bin_27]